METIKKELQALVDSLKKRPNLVIQKIDGFNSYKHFFDGYFYAIDRLLKFPISINFSRFLNKIENNIELGNVPWCHTFDAKYSNESDEVKIEKLLSLIEEFRALDYYFNFKF